MNWNGIAKINNPVTLTAFALALVFFAMSRVKRYRWWPVAAMCLAAITVIGGLALVFIEQSSSLVPNAVMDVKPPLSSASAPVHAEPHAEKPSVVNVLDAPRTKGDGSSIYIGSQINGNNTTTIIKGMGQSAHQ